MFDPTLLSLRPDPVGSLLLAVVFTFGIASADIPEVPRPLMVTSQTGEFLFKMVPAEIRWEGEKRIVESEAFGVAYHIEDDGALTEQWRTEGWYTFEPFLSNDGRYLARIGPWASDWEKKSDLAIAFYDEGKLLKRYEVRELIKDLEALLRSSSHYNWRPDKQTVRTGFSYDGAFQLVTIDKTHYTFDAGTGEVIEEGVDSAKSYNEIWADDERLSMLKAKQLYKESSFRAQYDKHFSVTELEARGFGSGVHFPGPQWSARLLPKKGYPENCEVSVIFPIDAIDGLETTITPAEIDSALEAALRHPWIKARFELEDYSKAAYGLRMRITGDRLHRKTEELQKRLASVGMKAESPAELRPWAYIIIDAREPRYTSLYLNVETGDLIFEDPSTWPRKILRFDSEGKPVKAP